MWSREYVPSRLCYLTKLTDHLRFSQQIVKFIIGFDDPSQNTITSVDKGILELKEGVENLENAIETLQTTIKEYVSFCFFVHVH